jgi:hypothetical protein
MDAMVANDRAVDAMYNGVEFTERSAPSTPSGNKVHVYAKDKSGVSTIYVINDAGTEYELAEYTPTFVFPVAGTLFTGTSLPSQGVAPKALTITKAYASVKTAPTGASLIVDINKNGTSIWNSTPANRLTITATNTSGTQTSFDTTSLAESDVLTVDIDQVGSTVAGADLVVLLKCK